MSNEPDDTRMSVLKRPWIKICGLTDPDNALACAELHPDAIGLIFYKKSPRHISMKQAARITGLLPEDVMAIGVFVDNSFEDIMEKVRRCGLNGVQLHGNESPGLADRLKKENLFVIKALFAAKEPHLNQATDYSHVSALLVEYGKGRHPGGNAETWNYEIPIKIKIPVIIAGGLSEATIANALKAARPFGVDVSSGVEISPGKKDINKVESFIARVNALTNSLKKA